MHSTRWGVAASVLVPAAERYLAGAPAENAGGSVAGVRRRWLAWTVRRRPAPAGVTVPPQRSPGRRGEVVPPAAPTRERTTDYLPLAK